MVYDIVTYFQFSVTRSQKTNSNGTIIGKNRSLISSVNNGDGGGWAIRPGRLLFRGDKMSFSGAANHFLGLHFYCKI